MCDADVCAKQKQLGVGKFTPTNAIFHDDDEERDGANENECYCHIGNQRHVPAPNNARPHFRKPIYKRAPLMRLFVGSVGATVKHEIVNRIIDWDDKWLEPRIILKS